MTGNTEIKKLKEEYPDAFKNIPDDIAEVVLSDETPLKIADICLKNGVEDEAKIERAAYLITLTLLGKLPIEELNATMEKELKISQDATKKFQDEINQNIFFQIKDSLKKLYGKELPKEAIIEELAQGQSALGGKPKRPPSKDVYREPVE